MYVFCLRVVSIVSSKGFCSAKRHPNTKTKSKNFNFSFKVTSRCAGPSSHKKVKVDKRYRNQNEEKEKGLSRGDLELPILIKPVQPKQYRYILDGLGFRFAIGCRQVNITPELKNKISGGSEVLQGKALKLSSGT
jgi:hypothetical protein